MIQQNINLTTLFDEIKNKISNVSATREASIDMTDYGEIVDQTLRDGLNIGQRRIALQAPPQPISIPIRVGLIRNSPTDGDIQIHERLSLIAKMMDTLSGQNLSLTENEIQRGMRWIYYPSANTVILGDSVGLYRGAGVTQLDIFNMDTNSLYGQNTLSLADKYCLIPLDIYKIIKNTDSSGAKDQYEIYSRIKEGFYPVQIYNIGDIVFKSEVPMEFKTILELEKENNRYVDISSAPSVMINSSCMGNIEELHDYGEYSSWCYGDTPTLNAPKMFFGSTFSSDMISDEIENNGCDTHIEFIKQQCQSGLCSIDIVKTNVLNNKFDNYMHPASIRYLLNRTTRGIVEFYTLP